MLSGFQIASIQRYRVLLKDEYKMTVAAHKLRDAGLLLDALDVLMAREIVTGEIDRRFLLVHDANVIPKWFG